MKTREEFKVEALAKWREFYNRDAIPEKGAEELISWMMENCPQENQPEKAEPKPRWRDKRNGENYEVRKLGDSWVIWFDPNDGRPSKQTLNLIIKEIFPRKQEAIDALDEWCMVVPDSWERCDEGEIMSKIEIEPKFQRGDIVTMKSMAEHPEQGHPQRMEVRYWQAVSGCDNQVDMHYWVRLLWHAGKVTWNLHGEQCFSVGTKLATGEVLIGEAELCLYVPNRAAAEAAKEK